MTTESPDGDGPGSPPSLKRNFSVSSGQSAEQYMSQLLTQKRFRMNEEEDSDENEDDDEPDLHTRAGNLKRLVLKNFMCHDHFELNFGPRMNFIIGRNGSGKSAVLTGISVGLGAKATDTNRGSSTKSLIKDGKSMARIVVEINNDGLDSVEQEVYGKTIIVERKLTRDNSGSYAIKSENGTLVSTKKRDLDELLQRFFIVVNNPLSFLSQDKAREFIASSTEQTRFNYFSEGTNIQSIISNYQEASKDILSLQSRSLAARAFHEDVSRKYVECERNYRKYKHSHTLRQQLEKVNGKIYWFNVEVLERRIAKKEADITERQNEVAAIDQNIKDNEGKIDTYQEEFDSTTAAKAELTEQMGSKEQELKDAEALHNDAEKKISVVRSDLMNYKTEIEEYNKQILKHQEGIAKEQAKLDEANGGSKEAMGQRLELLKKRQKTLSDARDDIQNQLHGLSGVSPEMEALNRELEEVKRSISSLREKIGSFERNKNDRYAAFGLNVGYLMRDIEQETGWHQKPIGPIGYFCSVKSEFSGWSDLINATLQKSLDSFVVSDEHDRQLLTKHMRNKKIFKNIIVRKFEKFNYNTSISGQHTTFLDTLEIQNEDVKFTLIDSTGVEEIVICNSINEAENVTRQSGVKNAFCLSDRNSGVRLTRRDGNLSRDPVFYSRDLRKLAGKVNGESLTQELDELMSQEAQIQKKRNQLRGAEHEKKKQLQAELAEKKGFLKEVSNSIFAAEHALNEEGDHGRIESLKAQIELCENQIKTREGMSMELLQNMNESKKSFAVLKKDLQAKQAAQESLRSQITELDEKLTKMTEEVQLLEAEIDRLKAKRAEELQEVVAVETKLEQDRKKHKELQDLAEERCARSEVTLVESDSTESITQEFRAIQEAIEEAEKSSSKSFEDIQKEVLETKAMKDKCEQSMTDIDNARVTLENDLNARFENLNITIKEKLTRAKSSFEQSLALRGFKGKLEFDFGRKRVITEVQTKDDKDTRAVSSLSGGEKSFTQIAFLLSIWKVMKPRVCGLDEFDVFMDSVNRTIAIRLLIHELRNSLAQSIFITPQDIAVVGDLNDSEDVRIHYIKPPRND